MLQLHMEKVNIVEVLGYNVRVLYSKALTEEWGNCCIDTKTITLSEECIGQPTQHWDSLIHEVTHMIFGLTGLAHMDSNDEEAYVRCVENLVVPWALANQHLRGPSSMFSNCSG